MSKSTNFMLFIAGAAVGSVVTWFYTKKKYELIAQEEIDSVRDVFSKRKSEIKETKFEKQSEKPDITEYIKKVRNSGYVDYSDSDAQEPSTTKPEPSAEDDNTEENDYFTYIITPDEFGEHDDYETISLTYYADQILADDCDDVIEDVEGTVGIESLTHFGEYEDDSVFVRNDKLKCDYEILLDYRKYKDVVNKTDAVTTEV